MPNQSVSIELTPDGYTPLAHRHPRDRTRPHRSRRMERLLDHLPPPLETPTEAPTNGLPRSLHRRRIRTLRLRDLFGIDTPAAAQPAKAQDASSHAPQGGP
jgi:hypothetical protein